MTDAAIPAVANEVVAASFGPTRLASAAAGVAVLTVLAKAVAAGKDVAVARTFGAGDEVDAFLVALAIPTLLINIIAGSLPSAVVPAYVSEASVRGREAAQRLLSSVLASMLVLLAVATGVLAIAAPALVSLVGSGFDEAKADATTSLVYRLLPVILLSGAATTFAAALNARARFLSVALVACTNPAATLVAFLILKESQGIEALAWASVTGFLAELLLVILIARRTQQLVAPRWRGWDATTAAVFRSYLPVAGGTVLLSSSLLVDQAVAATSGSGSVAALGFGTKLVTVIGAVFITAVGTVVLPHFSSLTAARDWDGVRRSMRAQLAAVGAAATLAALVLAVGSDLIVTTLYKGGEFGAADAALVARIQVFASLQLPFLATGIVAVRLLNALGANRLLLPVAGVSMTVNVVADLVLLDWLGVEGIALATSAVHVGSTTMIILLARRELRRCESTTRDDSVSR